MHYWPRPSSLPPNEPFEEADEICSHVTVTTSCSMILIDHFSSFTRLRRITTWVMHCVNNCRAQQRGLARLNGPLTVDELNHSLGYWVLVSQKVHFSSEIGAIKAKKSIPRHSPLLSLNAFMDGAKLLRVGGRQQNSKLTYDSQHPLILHGNHPITKLIIRTEHLRLLHTGPLLVSTSQGCRFHIVGGCKVICSITHSCITCHHRSL